VKTYQVRIELMNIEPPIWRRILVPASVPLDKLHKIIQIAMGWDNYHMYLFTVGREQYGEGVGEWAESGQSVVNAKRVQLQDVAPRKGAKLRYEYDMGDGWDHQVLVEGITDEGPEVIQCQDGARACPPEDCGGPGGYEEMLEIIFNPQHPEFEDRREWLGGQFDPEHFNTEPINRRLGRLKVRAKAA
jgi:hypothetical protein